MPFAPELAEDAWALVRMFYEVAAHRTWALGAGASVPNPIPYSEKVAWLDEHLIRGDERGSLLSALGRMDGAWRHGWHMAHTYEDVGG